MKSWRQLLIDRLDEMQDIPRDCIDINREPVPWWNSGAEHIVRTTERSVEAEDKEPR